MDHYNLQKWLDDQPNPTISVTTCYVVHEAEDKTEGRGSSFPKYSSYMKEVATYLAKNLGVGRVSHQLRVLVDFGKGREFTVDFADCIPYINTRQDAEGLAKMERRAKALAKLSPEDLEVLGLTK